MGDIENRELEVLFARLEDLCESAVRGEAGISAFLSPRELHYAEDFLRRRGSDFFGFGGYDAAERKRLYILPDYMSEAKDAEYFCRYGYSLGITALLLLGSGFEVLSHRTVMGSLLGLGIERSVVGDIVMQNEHSALVFCDDKIAEFLLSDWQKAGKDKIKLKKVTVDRKFAPKREYLPISDTVASPRLDAVVAALCKLSREKAREAVLEGAVELDYECQEHPDREVSPSAVISVRKYGKFKIISLADKTKKGRYRLQAEKYL